MPDFTNSQQTLTTEKAVLRVLCQCVLHRAPRAEAMRLLADYNWQGHDHQILFEALRRIEGFDAKQFRAGETSKIRADRPNEICAGDAEQVREGGANPIRAELPAELTRMGFPDFDIQQYFEAPTRLPDDVLEMIRRLIS